MTLHEKNFEKKYLVPWDPPGVPRVPISGPNRGIFSKLIGPGPLGSGGHSHTSFSNSRFLALETSFHIDVQWVSSRIVYFLLCRMPLMKILAGSWGLQTILKSLISRTFVL